MPIDFKLNKILGNPEEKEEHEHDDEVHANDEEGNFFPGLAWLIRMISPIFCSIMRLSTYMWIRAHDNDVSKILIFFSFTF